MLNRYNMALQQLDQVVQQNAAAAEEMASTSEELQSQAAHLQSSIAFFKVGNGTNSTSRAAYQPSAVAAGRGAEGPSSSRQRTRIAHLNRSIQSRPAAHQNQDSNGSPSVLSSGQPGHGNGASLHLGRSPQGDGEDPEFERY